MVPNRVKEFRENKELSQVELARRARMAPQNLSAIEGGKLAPWPKVKRSLARALKMTEQELFPSEGGQDGK